MNKIKRCIDCGKELSRFSSLGKCIHCFDIKRRIMPNYNYIYIDREGKRFRLGEHYTEGKACTDCGAPIDNRSTRCVNCSPKATKRYNGGTRRPRNRLTGTCKDCGKPIYKGSTYCQSCCQKGERNHSYVNGTSGNYSAYPEDFTVELREQIRKRDKYVCKHCGGDDKELGRNLSIHHIDYDKDNNDPSNLITLCVSCHMKTNVNRIFWYGFLTGAIVTKQRRYK